MELGTRKDIIQWDIKNWGEALDFWEPFLHQVEGKKAAAFGEREGGLSLWLSNHGFEVECSDYKLSEELPLALHRKYEVEKQVSYSNQDITEIYFPDNTFDVVMFKSVIGALGSKEKQDKALSELHRILKPGGYLLFAENLEATKLHNFARKKFTDWGHRWRYLRWTERMSQFSHFSGCMFKAKGFSATFGRSEKQRNVLASFDRVINPFTPNSWRYILFGACRK